MKAPWNGEKVNVLIRFLAIAFVICAVIVFVGLLFELLTEGEVNIDIIDFRTVIGMVGAPYYFLLFLKVAVTGKAPTSWIPWK